jgi:hypothetical protein
MSNINVAASFIAICFHARTVAHQAHFTTGKYATHKALEHFYENIIDLVDRYAESFMGEHGRFKLFPASRVPSHPKLMLPAIINWIKNNRSELGDVQQPIVDEILELFTQTHYQLTQLN